MIDKHTARNQDQSRTPLAAADAIWDAIIVGQGLAGTTLAWHLSNAGQRVLLVDDEAAVSASKIAAGLITPITGQRLTLGGSFNDTFATAAAFYQACEVQTGRSFFHARSAVRLFQSDTERQSWSVRSQQAAYQAFLATPQPVPLLGNDVADTSGGGFVMRSAQLDVGAYLSASLDVLAYAPMKLDWNRDVTLSAEGVQVGGHRTRLLISCEGYRAAQNPFFAWVPFKAAKGDVLTVRFARPVPPVCVHRGIWIAPTLEPQVCRVGSTYDWATLDQDPSVRARDALESQLNSFMRLPYAVIDHQAAVRPILVGLKPRIGLHPEHARLGYFNGLGSKGSLLAPWFAQCFTRFLVDGTPLPAACDVATLCSGKAD